MEYNTTTNTATGTSVEIAEFVKSLGTKKETTKKISFDALGGKAKLGRPAKRKNKSYTFEEDLMVTEFLKDKDNYVSHKAGHHGLVLKGVRVRALARKLRRSNSGVKTHLNILRREKGVGF